MPSTTPRDEENALLSEAISLAVKLLADHHVHVPFAIAIQTTGEFLTVAADDREHPTADQVLDSVRAEIRAACSRGEFRAVALARNVDYPDPRTGTRRDAVQITIDHAIAPAVTCYLPYTIAPDGTVNPGELFAVEPAEIFFAKAPS